VAAASAGGIGLESDNRITMITATSIPLQLNGRGTPRALRCRVLQSPLAGVSDRIFRGLVRRWAPDALLFTEMVNATSLELGHGLIKVEELASEPGPIGVQLFDHRPAAMADAARRAEQAGAFLIDINMGCPVKKIARKGGGSGLIRDPALAQQPGHGVMGGDEGAGDGRRARAAVGLQHVAVDGDGVLPQRRQVDAGPQRPADQPADLVGAPTDAAFDRLAVRPSVGGGRQHRVLGGQPAQPGAFAPARYALGDARGAHHPGTTELDEHRSSRV
jgi:hypothetical protein